MSKVFGIVDVLSLYGFKDKEKTKLVRHQETKYGISKLIDEGWFELYQRIQARQVFKDCHQIVSFLGDGGHRARFIGVYKVLAEDLIDPQIMGSDCPYREWLESAKYQYELERCPEYGDLEGRLVIDWGSGALAWHQHLKNKPVIEIEPSGRSLAPFTDYLDFSLTYNELQKLVSNPESHRDWKASLSAVAGVYAILAKPTGQLYIGSAYGSDGIWSRWSEYAKNGHGGNTELKKLVSSDEYPNSFQYSILQVLPKTTTPKEVIRWESAYKLKLGSRVTGLNLN